MKTGWSSTPFLSDMKRIITALLMTATLLMTSCTEDSERIVGTWYASEMSLTVDGKTITTSLSDYNWEMVYLFYSDGKGAIIESISGVRTMKEFTWVLNGNSLTMTRENESSTIPITLSNKELSIVVDQEVNGKTHQATIYFYR